MALVSKRKLILRLAIGAVIFIVLPGLFVLSRRDSLTNLSSNTTEARADDSMDNDDAGDIPLVEPGQPKSPADEGLNEGRVSPYITWRELLLTTADRNGVYALISDSRNSDLARVQAEYASGAASRFVVADLTGQGREEFGEYWSESATSQNFARGYQAQTVKILAVGSSKYDGGLIRTLVVYEGVAPDGTVIPATETTVLLLPQSATTFRPLLPHEYPAGSTDLD